MILMQVELENRWEKYELRLNFPYSLPSKVTNFINPVTHTKAFPQVCRYLNGIILPMRPTEKLWVS